MLNFFRCAVVALMLVPVTSAAQDFNAGLLAYIEDDYTTAIRVWTPLAEQGDASAQSYLGLIYYKGTGVLQNYAEAVQWFRLAAEQGNAGAQTYLGVMYYYGESVLQDDVSAHMWYNLAASNGSTTGQEARDDAERRMTPADISEAQQRARVCLASNYQDCG